MYHLDHIVPYGKVLYPVCMGKSTTGSRLRLGEPLATEFAAFRSAFYNAPEIEIIREALKEHIERVLDQEPERLKLFEKAKKQIMEEKSPKLAVVGPTKD